MKHILFLILIFTIQSCDVPTKARFQTVDTNSGEAFSSFSSEGEDSSNEEGSDSTTPNTGNQDSSTEPGFEDCNLEYVYSLNSMGYLAICKSSVDDKRFKIKMSKTDSSDGTCFVPINIQSNGNSFKLGIAECVFNQKDKAYNMTLTKSRSEATNGVMVIRASSLNSYMQCMNAKAFYISRNPGCEYQTQCVYSAEQYAYNMCSQFKNTHYQNYKQINL